MAGISNEAILLKSEFQFKGPLTENYCLQQLRDCFDILPQYFVQGQNQEIDFVVQNGMEIIPVEVKAGDSIHANSFKKYIAERKPKQAIRFSGLGYVEQETVINIPLYLAGKTKELLK